MGVHVVHVGPIDRAVLCGQAVGVDGCVHGPGMNVGKRVILIDEAHQVFVMVDGRREEFLVHPRAIRALEVVKVDDRHFGVGVATDGTTRDGDGIGGILRKIERVHVDELGVVIGDKEVDLGNLAAVRNGDGQGFVAGKRAWLAGANIQVGIRGQLELGAHQNLDAAIERGIGSGGWVGLSLAPNGEAKKQHSGQKTSVCQDDFLSGKDTAGGRFRCQKSGSQRTESGDRDREQGTGNRGDRFAARD